MAFAPFWDKHLADEIIEITDGSVVEYRGDRFYMHCEQPTLEVLTTFQGEARGVARILIGSRSRFPDDPERGTLITVDGKDWVLSDWRNSEDGEDIHIALSKTTRTDF